MPKWLSRTLVVVLVLVLAVSALYGAFYIGRTVGISNPTGSDVSIFSPRLDRDQVKPTLRDDGTRFVPWMHMPDRMFMDSRFPVIGFLLSALWAFARLVVLVLLILLIVAFVLRRTRPAPTAAPTPAETPVSASDSTGSENI